MLNTTAPRMHRSMMIAPARRPSGPHLLYPTENKTLPNKKAICKPKAISAQKEAAITLATKKNVICSKKFS